MPGAGRGPGHRARRPRGGVRGPDPAQRQRAGGHGSGGSAGGRVARHLRVPEAEEEVQPPLRARRFRQDHAAAHPREAIGAAAGGDRGAGMPRGVAGARRLHLLHVVGHHWAQGGVPQAAGGVLPGRSQRVFRRRRERPQPHRRGTAGARRPARRVLGTLWRDAARLCQQAGRGGRGARRRDRGEADAVELADREVLRSVVLRGLG
mmetsp:Transcript_111049/g.310632  ORF Transcript_111049/g.310632 Transcript_111049/m.310632 type:complete len:206 (+) Transcript_111049:316-933(+)